MNVKIVDHEKNTVNIIDYPGTVLLFVKIHFLYFGFYRVEKTARDVFQVYNKFDNNRRYTVSKASKGDMKK